MMFSNWCVRSMAAPILSCGRFFDKCQYRTFSKIFLNSRSVFARFYEKFVFLVKIFCLFRNKKLDGNQIARGQWDKQNVGKQWISKTDCLSSSYWIVSYQILFFPSLCYLYFLCLIYWWTWGEFRNFLVQFVPVFLDEVSQENGEKLFF